ncbi:MFS transporter [Hydrogenophaga sp. 5NK40-0174]
MAVMLALGFSSGLPYLLIFSSLSLWLVEAGVERKAVTYFSWAALGYSFKFIWAPLVDRLPLPGLTRWLGRRRSYLLLAQAGVVCAIIGMAMTDPAQGQSSLTMMAVFAVMLGFTGATQDIVIDAYRIEISPPEQQAILASAYTTGYRIGLILAGAGALYWAELWGSSSGAYSHSAWQSAYFVMAAAMSIGIFTTLLMREPQHDGGPQRSNDHARMVLVFVGGVAAFVAAFSYWSTLVDSSSFGPLLSLFAATARLGTSLSAAFVTGWLLLKLGVADTAQTRETWIVPIQDFFTRYGVRTAWLLLALIGLYRISDIVLGAISNIFYENLGFSKSEIAFAVKSFGVIVGIAGGFLGGILATRLGVMRSLFWGALLSSLTNVAFIGLAMAGHNVPLMYGIVAADNLAAGFASAAFVAFLSSLTNVSFTAVQYAIFSSLMTLLPKTLGGYSGGMVDTLGYPGFFLLTACLGIPVLVLVVLAGRHLGIAPQNASTPPGD